MADLSPILSLPLIQAAQAQKHVTHNEALMRLDLLVQLTVADRSLTTPPVSPTEGQRHIVATGATGLWAGQAGQIALWLDGVWQFVAPMTGWRAWVQAEGLEVVFGGTAWDEPAAPPLPDILEVDEIGISATSDATNRLALSSDASLFNHAGGGHQMKVNKSATGQTASLLFQTGFSGRAEMGTMGDDDFGIKVSADGSSYVDAIKVAAAAGAVTLAKPLVLTGQATAPVSPVDGMIWHDSTRGQLMAQIGGEARILDQQADLPSLVPPSGEWASTTMGSGGATTVLAGAANRIDIFPFVPSADLTVNALGINCTTAVAGALAKFVVYSIDANGRPDLPILETGTIDLATTGNKVATASMTFYRGRTYWLGIRHSATAAVSSWSLQATPDINGGTSIMTSARKTIRRTVTFASAAPSPWSFVSSEIISAAAPAIWLRMA